MSIAHGYGEQFYCVRSGVLYSSVSREQLVIETTEKLGVLRQCSHSPLGVNLGQYFLMNRFANMVTEHNPWAEWSRGDFQHVLMGSQKENT